MNIRRLMRIAVFSAVLCVVSPFSIPIVAVPLSLCTLGIYVCSAFLPPADAAISVIVYVLLGVFGVPVFAGFRGGLSVIAGPTGGYIAGYAVCAFVASYFIRKFNYGKTVWIWYVLSTVVLYLFAVAWYAAVTDSSFVSAATVCVLPFLPGDAVKIAAALVLIKKCKGYICKKTDT